MYKYLVGIMILFTSGVASGQVQAANRGGAGDDGLYASFSGARPNYGEKWLVGPSFGGYLQVKSFLGIDARGSILRWGPSPNHQYLAVAGPRVAFRKERFTIYAAGEGGVGHARYPGGSDLAAAWLLTAGVDYQIHPRIKLRLGEFSYGDIYVLQQGLNPKIISAGVVFRPF